MAGNFPLRHLLPLICLIGLPLCANAGERGEQFKSPSGQHVIFNLGDTARAEAYFELRTAKGEVLFSSNNGQHHLLGLDGRFPSTQVADVRWSPDGQFVLFAFDDGRYKAAALYSFADRMLISLGHIIDGYTVPIRWVSSRTFVVEHHWPMGGKARPQTRFRETYRIHSNPFTLTCVYKSAKTRDKEQEDAT